MKQVSTRQLCMVLVVSAFSLKLLFLPALLTELCGNVAYLVLFLTMGLDLGILTIFLYIQKLEPDKSIKDIMKILFGGVISKIIFFLYFMLFTIKSVSLFQSLYIYLTDTLYRELDVFLYAIVFLLTLFYILTRRLKVKSRFVESAFWLITTGLMTTFVIGGIKADFTNILLPFEMPGVSFWSGYKVLMWFGDYLIFMFLMGEIRIDKKYLLKIYLALIANIVLVAGAYIIFYCLYGNVAISYTNTVTDVIQVLPPSADVGRIGWLVVLIWTYGLFIEFLLLLHCGAASIEAVITTPNSLAGNIIMLLLCFGSIFVFKFDITVIIRLITEYGSYFAIVMQYFVPLLMLIMSFRLKRGE